jgi:transcriptional regulator with XRE-family HTH domain
VENIGAWIRSEREKLGLSIRQLAHLTNVGYPTISRIEMGRDQPRWETVLRLATAFGKTLGPHASEGVPRLADLAGRWQRDAFGEPEPNWTLLRAFADTLRHRPELTATAIAQEPMPSGAALIDNLLAAIAETVADDASIKPPQWTKRFPPLREPWATLTTPRRRAEAAAGRRYLA